MDGEKYHVVAENVNLLVNEHMEEYVERLMKTYGPELMNLAYLYVGDWGKAEEIAQDVFFICFKKFNTFRGDASIKTWLYRITINRSKDMLRSWPFRNLQVRPLKTMLSLESDTPSPEEVALRHSEREQMAEKVFALPVKYREVIMLYYYSDLNAVEIGRLIDKKPKTVRTRLRRARQLLGQMMKEADEDEK